MLSNVFRIVSSQLRFRVHSPPSLSIDVKVQTSALNLDYVTPDSYATRRKDHEISSMWIGDLQFHVRCFDSKVMEYKNRELFTYNKRYKEWKKQCHATWTKFIVKH